MTRRIGPARTGRVLGWTLACVLLLLPAGARAAKRWPELDFSLGGTMAVEGTPSEGGPSASLAAMWPVAGPFSFGVVLHADDAGSQRDSLRDAEGRTLSYGKVEQVHRSTYGASWRGDVLLPSRLLGFTPALSATWGYYRIRDDVHGSQLHDVETSGCSLAALLRRPLGRHFGLGASARYHWLFNGFEKRFVNVSVEGMWR